MHPKTAAVALALALALGLPFALAQTTTQTTGVPSAEQAQAIIKQLLESQSGANADVKVTYGGVPASLPLTLGDPLSVLMSIRTSYNGGGQVSHRVLIDSALPPTQARAELNRRLRADGWKVQGTGNPPLGFVTPQQPVFNSFYREGATPFLMTVGVTSEGNGSRLELGISPIGPQQLALIRTQASQTPKSSLPLMTELPGAKITLVSNAAYPNGALSTVRVQSAQSAGEVLAFYSAQLKAAGWRARAETDDGPLRAVTYTLRDVNGREALGTLGIRPWEKDGGGYVLTVSVQGFKP